ncbi:GNAT family N-acetyltransferase [Halopseudomonas yangmingensis]|uniref:Predicted N-acyltransferase, GNAT family n=1 Tax=Halopseudomonas yangmingensis TaxID=1720063 RepID=A0A1I4QJS8_9GAMM|nr:GNAT family N-acetyltransferase [Halopseudomonas yangmingensis]SFM39920.1 Predicted N-acyltransferase, GNAT family [Halopseudomonas yangmingensis]
MKDVQIELVDWRDCPALRDIRTRVFVEEQQVPAELEWDDQDATATHFLMTVDGQSVGTARLLADGHIGRVAILPQWRGNGYGLQLMRAVIEHARQSGMQSLELSAQTQAIPFYTRLGFAAEGDEYMEAGIAHRHMVWQDTPEPGELPPIEFTSPGQFSIHNPDIPERPRHTSELPFKLGDYREALEINEDNALEHACNLALQAQRSLLVYAPDQAGWLFQQRSFIDCCEQLIARQPRCKVRFLLHEVRDEFLRGHSLLYLMHRFPSTCEIRRQHPDLPREPQIYLLVDSEGILLLPRPQPREGFVRYHSPDQVKRWSASFNELWDSSLTDPALRRFML